MERQDELLIRVATSPASDNWGFVGVVAVGEHEAYRTIRAYSSPAEALTVTQRLLADVLGALMAGQEWVSAQSEFGHSPRRTELEFGLQAKVAQRPSDQAADADRASGVTGSGPA